MIKKLNARTVDSIKPTPGKRVDYFDSQVRGLVLRVAEHGAKSWSVHVSAPGPAAAAHVRPAIGRARPRGRA